LPTAVADADEAELHALIGAKHALGGNGSKGQSAGGGVEGAA
jgi:hypothetical protein